MICPSCRSVAVAFVDLDPNQKQNARIPSRSEGRFAIVLAFRNAAWYKVCSTPV
jgi:hypothetical protein